jgi:hypothetical protein
VTEGEEWTKGLPQATINQLSVAGLEKPSKCTHKVDGRVGLGGFVDVGLVKVKNLKEMVLFRFDTLWMEGYGRRKE